MITTCSRLVNNWEQAVRTHLVDDQAIDCICKDVIKLIVSVLVNIVEMIILIVSVLVNIVEMIISIVSVLVNIVEMIISIVLFSFN